MQTHADLSCNSPESEPRDPALSRSGARNRGDEASFYPQAFEILETACNRFELSLRTFCQVHSLLTDGSTAIGGKLREGPAVIRLDGRTTYAPPPAGVARDSAAVFVAVLAEHLAAAGNEVPPAVLAAECVARLTDLHPFPDGNGRLARAIATWLLVRAGYRLRQDTTLARFFHLRQHEHYASLRHNQIDPWSWHQFFFDAVLACFSPP
jgi:Fic family protein